MLGNDDLDVKEQLAELMPINAGVSYFQRKAECSKIFQQLLMHCDFTLLREIIYRTVE